MTTSPPSVPPSFDPALHLHSEGVDDLPEPPSETFSDELDILHHRRVENIRNKVVIQHRAWNLSDVFRSDEDIRPETPTRPGQSFQPHNITSPSRAIAPFPSSPPVAKMPFLSSPVGFPSDAPSPESQKRKNDAQPQASEPKRQRIMGGFLDEDEEDSDNMEAFGDAHLHSEFELQEQLINQEPTALSQPPPLSQALSQPTIRSDLISDARAPGITLPFSPRSMPCSIPINTCSGKTHNINMKKAASPVSYEKLVASRSTTNPGRAQKSYYGIDIHQLLDEAAGESQRPSIPIPRAPAARPSLEESGESEGHKGKRLAAAMWTEKYRARKFTELIGDERTHRGVMRWLKGWDPVVYPNLARSKQKKLGISKNDNEEEKVHKKVLLLCGPPGLGKTTLAHVCARQAGYEVLEINASDDRSRDVVKGRIRDALATENVKGISVQDGDRKIRKAGRPVCVVVDEVDGVVSGSGGGGEGGFMKALIDLVLLDQKNSSLSSESRMGRKRKGDNFRFLRPLIMVCNDVYHPSLRPLRTSGVAEIVHVRQAPLENVVSRMRNIFTKEGIPADNDGVRRLCEASWGLSRRKQAGSRGNGTAEGDIRTVLVAAEWVAHKLKHESAASLRLTRSWLEHSVLSDAAGGGSFLKGLNRGGVRDIVERVFAEGAGFSDAPLQPDSFVDPFDRHNKRVPVGVADLRKRHAINRLREMIDASGDHDRCAAECFASYPLQSFQDDTFLSKPNAAYDWLHFHDSIASKVHSKQEWELAPYLSQSVVAFHHLFASTQGKRNYNAADDEEEEHPFSGPRADFAAFESLKQNRAILTEFQASFSAPLLRLFRSTDCLVTDLIPSVMRMLSPNVKPVVVRGAGDQRSMASVRKESERALVLAAVRVMAGLGVTFERIRVDNLGVHGGWVYRMEPPLDSLVSFSKMQGTPSGSSSSGPVRYAVRQVLDQEYRNEQARKATGAPSPSKLGKASMSKSADGQAADDGAVERNPVRDFPGVKRDFFGRIIKEATPPPDSLLETVQSESSKAGRKAWVTYHDGFSNAVRKPISMVELLAEF